MAVFIIILSSCVLTRLPNLMLCQDKPCLGTHKPRKSSKPGSQSRMKEHYYDDYDDSYRILRIIKEVIQTVSQWHCVNRVSGCR